MVPFHIYLLLLSWVDHIYTWRNKFMTSPGMVVYIECSDGTPSCPFWLWYLGRIGTSGKWTFPAVLSPFWCVVGCLWVRYYLLSSYFGWSNRALWPQIFNKCDFAAVPLIYRPPDYIILDVLGSNTTVSMMHMLPLGVWGLDTGTVPAVTSIPTQHPVSKLIMALFSFLLCMDPPVMVLYITLGGTITNISSICG